jgi:hypothetical protein
MKKQVLILLVLLCTAVLANAQKEFRLAKATGQLKLNLKEVSVEGYNGKEIIFSGQGVEPEEVDERAKGLMPISASGVTDNTGLGISVTTNGNEIAVKVASKKRIGQITIKVPENMKVIISENLGLFYATESSDAKILNIKNLKSELEISSQRSTIKLENNTGPMNIKTIYGAIEAVFNGDVKGPISIISVYDYVDITLPASTKADIELGTSYGKIYAGKEFNIDFDKTEAEKPKTVIVGTGTTNSSSIVTLKEASGSINRTYSNSTNDEPFQIRYGAGEKIKGKLNGGGVNLIFKSNNKNVYLRQK